VCLQLEPMVQRVAMAHYRFYIICAFILFAVLEDDATSNVEFVHKCIDSRYHKTTPGKEGVEFVGSCKPWTNYSCCTANTSSKIHADVLYSLHKMVLDQCPTIKNMSSKCREHFKHDTCFYECSPNLSPWIVRDGVSKVTRKERAMHIPLCADDCDQWFHDCKDDYTCSGNWGNSSSWNWKKKGSPEMCTQPCKTFSEYYKNPKTFCEKIFNYSFAYGSNNRSECMQLWPKSWEDNLPVAKFYAKLKQPTASAFNFGPTWFAVMFLPLFSWIVNY